MDISLKSLRQIPVEEKVRTFSEMTRIIAKFQLEGMAVVLAQGVFDLIHLGHIGYLQESSKVAGAGKTLLVVGIENDETVRLNKGRSRPVNTAKERMEVLAEFVSVSFVFTYDDVPDYWNPDDYVRRWRNLNASAITVPSWDPHLKVKEWQAAQSNSKLALVNYQHINSTTLMLDKVGYGSNNA